VAAAKFVLTENERIATSTVYSDGVLICRPMGLLRWGNLFFLGFALVVSLSLVGGLPPDAGPAAVGAVVVAAMVMIGSAIGWSVAFARSQVRADSAGLTIRDRLRGRHFAWDDVETFGVVHQRPPVWWIPNFSAGFTWHVWPDEAIPVVRLQGGSERRLHVLTSSGQVTGWSLGDVTPAEQRAIVLNRFLDALREAQGESSGGDVRLPV
jgi:hypothetical protein